MRRPGLLPIAAALIALSGCAPEAPQREAGDCGDLSARHSGLTQEATGFWTTTGSMTAPRQMFPATLLGSGIVLVSGGAGVGVGQPTTEVYDPATGIWLPVGDMVQLRYHHTASLLASGKVLAAGGRQSFVFRVAELYDPATGTWSPTGSMAEWRHSHAASVLASGEVLVAGGHNGASHLNTAELYDPAGVWFPAGNMSRSRTQHTATRLASGKVLVIGGFDGMSALQDVEVYDPATNAWSPAGAMSQSRSLHTATLLGSGKVLVTGGFDGTNYLQSTELYDPASDTWLPAAEMSFPRSSHTASLLGSGAVLVAGGYSGTDYPLWAEMYDPITNAWLPAGSMAGGHVRHAASTLDAATVLIAGGWGGSTVTRTAELFRLKTNGESCIDTLECKSGLCIDDVCCDTPCDGACDVCAQVLGATADGTCTPLPLGSPGSPSCSPYVCNGADGTCPATCSSDTVCILSTYCASNGTCQPDQANGNPCISPAQCQSGHCIENVCCDSACNETCRACTFQNTGLADGTCGLAKDGSLEIHGQCLDQGVASCKHDGFCDGNGQCRSYPAGSVCFPATCAGNSAVEFICGSSGACQHVQTSCGLYGCENGACNTSCTSDADCATLAFCDAGTCTGKDQNGTACTSGETCASSFCTDGFCCDAPCMDQCEACDVPEAKGSCIPISGAPHGSRPACMPGTGDDPCAARLCDGIERTECRGYAGVEVPCKPGCFHGVETGAGVCNGSGHCADSKPCGDYACGPTTCNTSCADGSDCAENRGCVEGQCIAGAACVEERFFVAADGTVRDCSPFTCETSGCNTACGSVDDCLPPLACDTGKCVPRPLGGLPDGCSCRMAEKPLETTMSVWFVLTAAVITRRRRKRTGDKPRSAVPACFTGSRGRPSPADGAPDRRNLVHAVERQYMATTCHRTGSRRRRHWFHWRPLISSAAISAGVRMRKCAAL